MNVCCVCMSILYASVNCLPEELKMNGIWMDDDALHAACKYLCTVIHEACMNIDHFTS